VRESGVGPGDLVVEIGAGTGLLTRALGRTGAAVLALELDPGLASQLRRRFERSHNVTVLHEDVLRWSRPSSTFSVVSNLPFASSGAILDRLLADPRLGPRQAHVIVQWEFAAKHGAVWPATLRGIYWRAWYDVAIVGRLARTAFAPVPSVDAAVVRITKHSQPLVPVEDHAAYRRFLSASFRSRRPVRRAVGASLSPLQVKRLASALGFAANAQPRDLDARQWARLFEAATARHDWT
jgi:23S rRNA (adenine-N6)-dimethyltransferase